MQFGLLIDVPRHMAINPIQPVRCLTLFVALRTRKGCQAHNHATALPAQCAPWRSKGKSSTNGRVPKFLNVRNLADLWKFFARPPSEPTAPIELRGTSVVTNDEGKGVSWDFFSEAPSPDKLSYEQCLSEADASCKEGGRWVFVFEGSQENRGVQGPPREAPGERSAWEGRVEDP